MRLGNVGISPPLSVVPFVSNSRGACGTRRDPPHVRFRVGVYGEGGIDDQKEGRKKSVWDPKLRSELERAAALRTGGAKVQRSTAGFWASIVSSMRALFCSVLAALIPIRKNHATEIDASDVTFCVSATDRYPTSVSRLRDPVCFEALHN
jgi:hypothetical protein